MLKHNLPNTRIVGVDPGLNITGYAVVEKQNGRLKLIEAGMIRGRSRSCIRIMSGRGRQS
jgi:crossover junction endodeoxyribonuclease RuvC